MIVKNTTSCAISCITNTISTKKVTQFQTSSICWTKSGFVFR